MEKSTELGMQTFDAALYALVAEGAISAQEALKNADSVNNLKLRMKLSEEANAGNDTTSEEWGLID
ncbi:hypothetical protein D3C81_1873460 [compost metagenome]